MTVNEVDMQPGVVRGDETIHYPTDQIHLRGVGQGNVQVVEYVSCDREGSPRHAHEWDGIEVVIDGEVEFTVGDDVTLAGPGAVQYLPAGVPHTVRVPAREARVRMVTIGPPYDGFAREMARLFAADAALADIGSEANRFGVTLASSHGCANNAEYRGGAHHRTPEVGDDWWGRDQVGCSRRKAVTVVLKSSAASTLQR